MDELLTTQQVAERLGVTASRVRQMVADGALPATRMGRDNFIKVEDLKLVADRKPGRPPKAQTEKASEQTTKKRGNK
jgi:excisionase family DNA binding protein